MLSLACYLTCCFSFFPFILLFLYTTFYRNLVNIDPKGSPDSKTINIDGTVCNLIKSRNLYKDVVYPVDTSVIRYYLPYEDPVLKPMILLTCPWQPL